MLTFQCVLTYLNSLNLSLYLKLFFILCSFFHYYFFNPNLFQFDITPPPPKKKKQPYSFNSLTLLTIVFVAIR